MARECRATARTQHTKRIRQAVGDLLGRQHAHAGRGQLDGQREAVQPPADVADRADVGVGEPEGRERTLRPVNKELQRFLRLQRRHEP